MKPEKQISLLAVCIIVLALFFMLPRNSQWVGERIIPYWKDFQQRKNELSLERRKTLRYHNAYTYSQSITSSVTDTSKALVLMPSEAYFKKYGIDYPVPEPAVFYYFTGLKTTWATSPMAVKANWVAGFENGHITVKPIAGSEQLQDSIDSFKKYGYGL